MSSKMFGGLTLKELALRSWRESNEDNIFGRAAELAYYFLLALFPMLIFLTAMVGFMPGLRENIMETLSTIVPGDAMKLVSETIEDVTKNSNAGLLSFGILGTLWAASNGVTAGNGHAQYGLRRRGRSRVVEAATDGHRAHRRPCVADSGRRGVDHVRRQVCRMGRRRARSRADLRNHIGR